MGFIVPRLLAAKCGQRLTREFDCGFTMIETLMSLAILGVVLAVALPSFKSYQKNTLVAQCEADLSDIAMRLEKFKAFNYSYPWNLSDLGNIPSDPWGNAYQYLELSNVNDKNGKVKVDLAGDKIKGPKPKARKKKNLKPLNSDYDLFSTGEDGRYKANLSAADSLDDCIRADDGAFIGLAADY